jgi:hypothetical protein
MRSFNWARLGIIAGIAAVVIVLPFVIYFAAVAHDNWVQGCEAQGGHVVDDTKTYQTTTYDAKGKPSFGTSSSTTYYCLNENGGIIDIE